MNYQTREHEVIFQTYKRFPLVLTRGNGARVWTEDGKEYLDFLAGIAVNALGHSHPAINQAITHQLSQIGHTSNLYFTTPMIELAQKILQYFGPGKVFYANSGAEANEAAIKLARKFHPDKWEIITCWQSFHGRTLAAISATGQPKYQKGFEPLVPGFIHVPYNDVAALEAAITPTTAAILVEPIQGEGGVIIPDAGYLAQVRALCDRHGILMLLDEVQTGTGRTGKFFCFEHSGIQPDVVTLAKAIGGGLPLGICVATDRAAAAFLPGDHASTFGGNPISCAAGLAVVNTIEQENLLEKCTELGDYLVARLRQKLGESPKIKEIRGKGLMIGIELVDETASEIVSKCLEQGLLLASAGPSVVRMLPPYIISRAQIDRACEMLGSALD
jgi:predicted acetylornithine/succinylornithine family transaminase